MQTRKHIETASVSWYAAFPDEKSVRRAFQISLLRAEKSQKIRQPEGNPAKKAEGRSPTPLTANHSKLRTDGVCIHAYTHSTHDCSHHRTKY